MAIPSAPSLLCRTIRMTVWRKRGSLISGVATRSWPASDVPGRASSGFDSATLGSIGVTSRTPNHSMTRLDRMNAIPGILPRCTGGRKPMLWLWRHKKETHA